MHLKHLPYLSSNFLHSEVFVTFLQSSRGVTFKTKHAFSIFSPCEKRTCGLGALYPITGSHAAGRGQTVVLS